MNAEKAAKVAAIIDDPSEMEDYPQAVIRLLKQIEANTRPK